MRATKIAIQTALRADGAVAALVPDGQIFSVERSTIPALPEHRDHRRQKRSRRLPHEA